MTPTSWRVLGASVRGSSHEARGTPCQDASAFEIIDDQWLVVAVADGAGSASHSDVGSTLAVRSAIAHMASEVRHGLHAHDEVEPALRRTVEQARETVFVEARERGIPAWEFSSTLLVALSGPGLTATIHVGDGAVVVAEADGSIVTFSVPEPSEHPNETTFLTSNEALRSARFVVAPRGVATIALLSDGLQMLALKFPSWDPFTPFFDPLFKFAGDVTDAVAAKADLERFLGSKKVRSKTDDDVTLVIAHHAMSEAPPTSLGGAAE